MTNGIPDRGDYVVLNFHPQSGHEQTGRRTGIVLSPAIFNDLTGFALICPTTNTVRGWPYEVSIPVGEAVTGVILTDQQKNLDWRSRNIKIIGQASNDVVNECIAKIKTFIS